MRAVVRDFPDGFLFGSSTAAHQVEGGNVNNDWWAWEHAPYTTCVEPSGDAIDQCHRYAEDFALLAGARPERAPAVARVVADRARAGRVQRRGARALPPRARRRSTQHGLTAFVTLHHFTLPRWLGRARAAGWRPTPSSASRATASASPAALGDLMPFAGTINEPQIVALMGYREGWFPPGIAQPRPVAARHARALIDAHAAAVARRQDRPRRPAGRASACSCPALEPARPDDPACVAACRELRARRWRTSTSRTSPATGSASSTTRASASTPPPPRGFAPAPDGAPLTQMGWELHPEGLHRAIVRAARAGLPVYVTENGIATADDAERVAYLRDHLAQVARALRDGVDVRGYLYWSAFDNFEWAEGYRPTFGLIGIDRDDGLRRVVRPSARAYGELARTRIAR